MAVNRPDFKEVEVQLDFVDDFDINARPEQSTSNAIGSGWEAADSLTTPTGSFPVDFKHSEQIQVIKFIDPDGPCATYKQHFLTAKAGKKSYVCLGTNCPLCTILNHRAEEKRVFSIVNFSAEGGPQRQILTATPRLFKQLHAAHFSPQGPLNKNYWSLSKSGEKQTTVYHLNAIKARDLDEDWSISAEDAETFLGTVEPYTRSIVKETSYEELLEIANSLL